MEREQITWLKTTNKSGAAAGNATFEMRRQREPVGVVSLKPLDVNCNCECEWGLPIRNSRRPPDERCPGTGCLLAHSEKKQTKPAKQLFFWLGGPRQHLEPICCTVLSRFISVFFQSFISACFHYQAEGPESSVVVLRLLPWGGGYSLLPRIPILIIIAVFKGYGAASVAWDVCRWFFFFLKRCNDCYWCMFDSPESTMWSCGL